MVRSGSQSDGSDSPLHSVGTKRTQDSSDGPASKRVHIDGNDSNIAVKVLVPSAAVGAIIGKGGEAMRNMKSDFQCHVHMSKNAETYPGTSERICLVKGRLHNVVRVIEIILEKIHDKCDSSSTPDAFDHKGMSRGNEMKIVVPNTSAGMVIGKAGANIKDIRESFGCQIQVFPRPGSPEAQNTNERVITIGHDDHSELIAAVTRVLEKVSGDPHHASEINKEDSGKLTTTQVTNTPTSSMGSSNAFKVPSLFAANPQPTLKLGPAGSMGNQQLLSFLENLRSTLRSSGFNEASVLEVMSAMQILAKYNIMGLGLGLGVAALSQTRTPEPSSQMHSSIANGGQGDQNAQSDAHASLNTMLLEVLRTGCPTSANGENFAASVMVERRISDEALELEVPDSIVGAVLGPKARTIQEINFYSGCKVQVHKRDARPDLPVGTRLISLTGDEKSMHICRLMIERVVNESQDRRAGART